MSTEDFSLAMQLRCAYFRRISECCTCGYRFRSNSDLDCLSHMLTCPHNTYGYRERHEEVVREQLLCIKRFSLNTIHEPKMFSAAEVDTRPDYVVLLPRISPVIDVTVVTNIAISHRDNTNCTETASRDKVSKHGEAVSSKGAYKFFPIAVEASGHCHSNLDELIALLSRELTTRDTKPFRRAFCFATSTGLQRGNVRILKHAYARLAAASTFGTRAWV